MSGVFEYPVLRIRVIDGDSQDIDCDMGFHTTKKCNTRIIGIDAPERGTDAGKAVTEVVKRWLMNVSTTKYRLIWRSHELDKYGRSLGDFYDAEHPSVTLSGFLLSMGLVRKYKGDARQEWAAEELERIRKLAEETLNRLYVPDVE